jgi:TonB C terminal
MTSAIKALVPLLLAVVLIAGRKGVAGSAAQSPADSAEKTYSAPTQGEGRKTGYLHTGDDSTTFIQWTKTDRQIKGQMQVLVLNREGKTNSRSFSFEGVFDNDKLSLTLWRKGEPSFAGNTITGTHKGNSLTLVWPQKDGTLWTQALRPASVAEYNDAARKLQERSMEIISGGVNPGTSKVPPGSAYGRMIQMILSRNFTPPATSDASEPQYVIVELRIARDGQILSLVKGRMSPSAFKQRSANDLVNDAAERAVIASNPLPPFPNGFLIGAQEAVAEIWFRYPK